MGILRSLQHPAIVGVKGLYERAQERLFFVMEFCEGGELFDRIVKKARGLGLAGLCSVSAFFSCVRGDPAVLSSVESINNHLDKVYPLLLD